MIWEGKDLVHRQMAESMAQRQLLPRARTLGDMLCWRRSLEETLGPLCSRKQDTESRGASRDRQSTQQEGVCVKKFLIILQTPCRV